MPAVTLTALFCGLALLARLVVPPSRSRCRARDALDRAGRTVALIAFVLLGLLGNTAISASSKSTEAGHLARAESQARRAIALRAVVLRSPGASSARPRSSREISRPRGRASARRSRRIPRLDALVRARAREPRAAAPARARRGVAPQPAQPRDRRRPTSTGRADEPGFTRDPLASPEALIRRVYAYAAYRLGDGPDAEDVTSEVFERALRYRASYDRSKGEPVGWLLGIARRCIDAALAARATRSSPSASSSNEPRRASVEDDSIRRLTLAAAVAQLGERDQELIALRFGADLTAAQIARLLELADERRRGRAPPRPRPPPDDPRERGRPGRTSAATWPSQAHGSRRLTGCKGFGPTAVSVFEPSQSRRRGRSR